jgi:hypothetical protein
MMSSEAVERKWLDMQAAIRTAVAQSANVVCLIPHWEPVDLETGLQWVQSRIYEGYYVKFRVDERNDHAVVRFLYWEYGDDEPTNWPEK